MMISPKRLTPADSKIIMLYILSKPKKRITYKVYLELVTTLSDINYFDFTQLLSELCQSGHVKEIIEKSNDEDMQEEKYYELTKEGENTLNLTIGMLAGIIKLRIDTNFIKDYKTIREQYSVIAEYIPEKSLVSCKIMNEEQIILKIDVLIKNEEEAKKIVRKWNNDAGNLYLQVLELLTKTDY